MSAGKKLVDYTWISTAQYVDWLGQKCGLSEVNLDQVWSMRVTTKGGIRGLLSRKIRLEAILKGNQEKLLLFAEEAAKGSKEKDFVQVLIGNTDYALQTVAAQVGRLQELVDWEQVSIEYEYVDFSEDHRDYGEVPF
jgi:hypothetical protein